MIAQLMPQNFDADIRLVIALLAIVPVVVVILYREWKR